MPNDAFRGLVHPYVDGELTGEERAHFEAHLPGCEACRRALTEERALLSALRPGQPLYATPAELRRRVESLLGPSRPRRLWTSGLAAAAVLALLAGAVVTMARRGREGHAPDASPLVAAGTRDAASVFASLAADTHLRFARGQLPLEVASERPEVISRWFEGRVPFHLQLPDYPASGGREKPYRLRGGRLVSFRDDYAAYVAYRMSDQPISLLVTSATAAQPEGGTTVTSGALTFHIESVAGLKVITWTDKGLTYALASDVAVEGAQSCVVCHGSADERRKLDRFPGRPGA
jgi:anti-sigma factor RsiW